ncbi:hypothetical protein OJF2_17400 [Aquisphaera giovannonii]|uniref:Protein BatD n=1 Tax=Aquisphaera giovannonii TaxID=406548 RepID=A0A5B9W002_9BACT|nr:BatD family protein [Aquisphaera giovannonii]QEH33240.1 hypothetical protein OJF2_17400 [Aquisphaera giovannonii]
MSSRDSRRFALLAIPIILTPAFGTAAMGRDPDSLSVRLEAEKGPYRVGQGIEIGVAVPARDERPTLELPAVRDARVFLAGTSFRPVSASAIGRVQSGENVFLTRVRLVPGRAGVLDVPPIVARLGDQSGRSQALRLRVEPVPTEGRPAGFLGGVGEFTLEADASPSSVRVGQATVYRIEIRGPAAWGSRLAPDLSRLAHLPIAPKIDELPQAAADDPPTRTFSFRILPTRPGDVLLPPVSISAYDPHAGQYFTKVTRSVPIRAVAVPELESGTVELPTHPAGWTRSSGTAAVASTIIGATLIVIASRLVRRGRAARRGPAASRRLARQLAARLASLGKAGGAEGSSEEMSPARFAAELMGALTTFASTVADRPPGALTPAEARDAFRALTGSEELASRASRLVEWCDRVLFSDELRTDGLADCCREAVALFDSLGRRTLRPLGSRRGPARSSP